jgi:hypothetical protein
MFVRSLAFAPLAETSFDALVDEGCEKSVYAVDGAVGYLGV